MEGLSSVSDRVKELEEEMHGLRNLVQSRLVANNRANSWLNSVVFSTLLLISTILLLGTFILIFKMIKEVRLIRESLAPFQILIEQENYEINKNQK